MPTGADAPALAPDRPTSASVTPAATQTSVTAAATNASAPRRHTPRRLPPPNQLNLPSRSNPVQTTFAGLSGAATWSTPAADANTTDPFQRVLPDIARLDLSKISDGQ